jgi:hypothetical protein
VLSHQRRTLWRCGSFWWWCLVAWFFDSSGVSFGVRVVWGERLLSLLRDRRPCRLGGSTSENPTPTLCPLNTFLNRFIGNCRWFEPAILPCYNSDECRVSYLNLTYSEGERTEFVELRYGIRSASMKIVFFMQN